MAVAAYSYMALVLVIQPPIIRLLTSRKERLIRMKTSRPVSKATAAGVLFAKLMNLFCKERINPIIGAGGVPAVPDSARVGQLAGAREDPQNFLIMHAMAPNVAGVIGSAVAAGVFLSRFVMTP
jgi:Na+-transporting methylmalonyl-CoA/oxaloacetate decarboxylase beta subunit